MIAYYEDMKLKKIFEKDWYWRKAIAVLSQFESPEKIAERRLIHRIKAEYRLTFGQKLHLRHPKLMNEKLIWLSLYWKNPLKSL